jgi:prepilin-type N-terminal cleavage/methylation domain-containing protein
MQNKGFTLPEALVALAIWGIVSVGALHLFWYASQHAARVTARQHALENARIAVDALVMNMQLADEITITSNNAGIMRRLYTRQLNPAGRPAMYRFYFDPDRAVGTPRHGRLEFGQDNQTLEFASGIQSVRLVLSPDRGQVTVTVTAQADIPVTLHGAADVRYKAVTVFPGHNP